MSQATGKLFQIVDSASKLLTSGNSFLRVLRDVKLQSVTPGRIKAEMLVQDEHSNELGSLQGGMATTIIDFYTSMAVLTIPAGDQTVTSGVSVNLNVDFFHPINVGSTITIDAYAVKSGKKIAYMLCDLYDKDSRKHCVQGKHIHYAVAKADIYKDFKEEDFK